MNRSIFLLAIVFLAASLAASAQTSGGIPPGHQMLSSPDAFADGHLAALDRQVSLTADQKTKARAVFVTEAKALFAVFGDKTLTQEQKQARIQQLHIQTRNSIWDLLSPDQRKLMNEGPPPPRPVA